ncbi:peptidoglycan binding protein CsiV [Shewanella mesophila]|uniref:peptidoglycan binding protein CsiV n=1 Tax=Shewanella mesophila TaxID=2864208 RepID=UPI001C65EF87|nr:peptidoglycan binding protein CsiV [Shewanella mesophila]QYJ87553.1 peptidoglycan binding protein CsiV [Shewanella mesophila]
MLKQSLALAASLFSISNYALADAERWFEVEIYIFERQGNAFEEMTNNPANMNKRQPIDMISPLFSTDITGASVGLEGCTAQQWIEDAERCNQQLSSALVSHPSSIPASIGAATPQYAKEGQSTVLLAPSQAQFNDMIATLNREPGHKSLLHMTWQQSMQPRHRATPIRLFAGDDFSERYGKDGYLIGHQVAASDIPQFNFDYGLGNSETKAPIWQLEGAINIYLNHYLHVETALTLHEEGTKIPLKIDLYTDDSASSTPVPYLFNIWMAQNKRVISDEIHYFDHPNMGMLLQIRKMMQPNEIDQSSLNQLGVILEHPNQVAGKSTLEPKTISDNVY